jgi:hypothetical protein
MEEPNAQQFVRPLRHGDKRAVQRLTAGDLPKRQSSKPRSFWGDRDGEASARRKVLRAIVRSFVGKPWDKCYSHILTKFKRTREADRVVLDGLEWFVEKNCVESIEGGRKVIRTSQGHRLHGDYYVHPKTGILLKHDPASERKPKKAQEKVVLRTKDAYYRKIGGVWYQVLLKKLPQPTGGSYSYYPNVHDVVLFAEGKEIARENGVHPNQVRTTMTREEFYRKYGSYSYAYDKRQLNKKELKTIIQPRIAKQDKQNVVR